MRDPDGQVQARQQIEIYAARPHASCVTASCFDAEATRPWLASGTYTGDQPGPPGGANGRAVLDIAGFPRATLVFDAGGRIVDVNALTEALSGYARCEVVGEPVDLVAARVATDEPLGRIRFLSAAAGAHIRHRSGRAIPVDVLLCPHDERATVAVFRTLETTDAGLLEDNVAQIVHDLKDPLSTIALEARLLDGRLADGHAVDTRAAVARITRNVEFLDRMVQDLLDLCSLNAGRLELHRQPTELRTLLERIIDRVVPTRDRARVSLHAAEPLTISIDELRIERVVANLLQNALKYAPRFTGIVVGLAAVNGAIRVSVTDAGPGLTPAETGFVFDKFRRASSARAHEGSGLGLYVSKRLVEAHGGRIDVTSVPGAGSQFFFELPAS